MNLKKRYFFQWILVSCFLFLIGSPNARGEEIYGKNMESWAKLSSEELMDLGEQAYQEEDFPTALQIYMLVTTRYQPEDTEDVQRLMCKGFIRCGNAQYQMLAYSSAMSSYLTALKIAEEYRLENYTGIIYAHIGNIYAANNDFESAATAYKRAWPYAEKFDNADLKSMVLNNLGGIYYFLGDIDSVQKYFRLFEELKYEDSRYTYDVYLNRAMLFNGLGKKDSAKRYAKKAREEAEKNGMDFCIGPCNASLAQFFEEEERLDSALFYLHLNENIARETHSNDLMIATVRDLERIYDKKQDREKALHYKSAYLSISDSILSRREYNELKNKQILYEMERNALTINHLNAVRLLQRRGIYILSVIVVGFIVMFVVLYLQKKKLKTAWNDLYESNHRYLLEEINYKNQIQELTEKGERDLQRQSLKTDGEEAESNERGEVEERRKGVVNVEQRDKIADEIIRIMETTEEYCAFDYGIDDLADSIHSNARYVSEVINEVFGKNFRTMLNEYRIKKAMIRLSDIENYGHFTIKAISEGVGYKSQATFNIAFAKFTGLKPSLYQKIAVEKYKKTKTSA